MSGEGTGRESEAEFLRGVESCYRRLRARPLLLSPADFRRAQDWYARGVPRWLVERTLEDLFERAQAADRPVPRSLAYCAAAVEEAFKAWRAVQVGPVGEAGPTGGEEPARLLERALEQLRASPAPEDARRRAESVLETLLAGGDAGGDDALMRAQRVLVDACIDALPGEERRDVDEAVARRLAPFRDRMEPALADRAERRALEQEILRRFRLPDLSLLPLLGG